MSDRVASTTELRRINKNRIYRLIYQRRQVTKQEIAQQLNLSLPTVSQNLKELMEDGLLAYGEKLVSTGGRKPKTYSIQPQARFAVGIEVTANHIRYIAVDLVGQELGFCQHSIAFSESQEYGAYLGENLEAFLDQFGLERERLLGVGISLPGIINNELGIVEMAPTLKLDHKMSLSYLIHKVAYPCRVDNDANDGGFAELWSRSDVNTMAYLSVGKGVGGAILIGNDSYLGDCKRSGEFGHMCVEPEGRLCNCGNRGCLEAYCSTARLSYDLNIQLEDFFVELGRGNQEYRRIWEEFLSHLVVGIYNIHTLLDCDVVLGGNLSKFLSPYLEEIRSRLARRDQISGQADYLRLSGYGAKSNSIGAALRYINQFMEEI